MFKDSLIHLNRELEPHITEQEYSKLKLGLNLYFEKTYSKDYTCNECSECCIFDVKEDLIDMVLPCPNGTLDDEEAIDSSKLIKFKFCLEKSLKLISDKNGIDFNYLEKSASIVFFGEKNANSKKYKFFYINRLIVQNKLNKNLLLEVKSIIKPYEKALIITPANFISDNDSEKLLKENKCELIFLPDLLKNNLMINKSEILNETDIKRIARLYELAIFNKKEVYFQGKKIYLHPQPYKLLNFLAENAGIAKTRDDCILNLWGEEALYNGYDKNLSDASSLIRTALKDAEIEKTIISNLIDSKNGCITLNIESNKVFRI